MKKIPAHQKIISSLCTVLLLFTLLITAAEAVCFWVPGFWRYEYSKYDTTSYVTGEMSLDDAVYVTEEMLEYCMGRLDSLDSVEATIDGITSPFFTERELLHLADCRDIFQKALAARRISLIAIAGLVIILIISCRTDTAYVLACGYIRTTIAVFIIAAVLAIIGISNFDWLFVKFHHVFFDNDLWLLDPAKDNLVNIMQEQVFAEAAALIAIIWAVIAIILIFIATRIFRKSRG